MEDIKNRFDEKKPFDVVRAEDFGKDLYEFYEPLERLIRKVSGVDIVGSRPVFLIGGRGTGKTMVLKYLSIEMQIKDFIKNQLKQNKSMKNIKDKEMLTFLSDKSFVGIYLHFRTTEYDSIKGEIKEIFKPYLSMKISEQLFKLLMIFKTCNLISKRSECDIVKYFIDQIKEPSLKKGYTFEYVQKIIVKKIFPVLEEIIEKNSYYSLEEIKKECKFPIIVSKNIIFGLADYVFYKLSFLHGKFLFILLDELEYLNEYQKRCIGQIIKDSDETTIIFKVGSRYMPENIYVGGSNEVLQELHDFRKINIADALNAAHSGRKRDYNKLVKKILNKRLNKSNFFKSRGIKKIEHLFPNVTIEKEARDLVKGRTKQWGKFRTYFKKIITEEETNKIIDCLRYPNNPIIEKLNMLLFYRGYKAETIKRMYKEYLDNRNDQYTLLYQKNSLNLLFQLYNDYRIVKKYAGIDVFVHLSSGIIRNSIEFCNQALKIAYNYEYEKEIGKPIGIPYQNMGAKHNSEIMYNEITAIPGNIGIQVQDFINQIGTIFKQIHLNKYLVEPEPTHFETLYSEITGTAKEIFNGALNYSYIQPKPSMDPKLTYQTKKNDYLLNRIFAPYFGISYRLRGRTNISPSQIVNLIEGSTIKKRNTRQEIIKKNTRRAEK